MIQYTLDRFDTPLNNSYHVKTAQKNPSPSANSKGKYGVYKYIQPTYCNVIISYTL